MTLILNPTIVRKYGVGKLVFNAHFGHMNLWYFVTKIDLTYCEKKCSGD